MIATTAFSLQFAYSVSILSPGDSIYGVWNNGGSIEVAGTGLTGGLNNFPSYESPDHAIDGVGQKYLNFAETHAGFMVSPAFNSGNGSVVTSLQIWTANDAESRDPASYELYGTNEDLDAGGMFLDQFSLISAGALSLPSSRNPGGSTPLDNVNSQTVTFANTLAYRNYLLLFPTVKDSSSANSVQMAEAQLFGDAGPTKVPDTGATLPTLAAVFGTLVFFRRTVDGGRR